METKIVKLKDIKTNPNNPRVIKDDTFKKLVKSIQEFPEMLNIRPLVLNSDMMVLGGNMRLRALQEAGFKEVNVIIADSLTEEQQKEFIIKDNVSFGQWDWDMLANEWEEEQLVDWGLDVINEKFETIIDKEYSNTDLPKSTDDEYSTFELVMLHENKLELLDTLNSVKNNYLFEKQEEALMEIIRVYNQK